LYAGQHINGPYLKSLIEYLDGRDFCINVISKSGTTTEPAIAFRVLKEYAEKRYGAQGARQRIIATTDRERGALRQLADASGYATFAIPGDIGGRFSVLTPVGLLPIAAAGVDIKSLCRGADAMRCRLFESNMESNPAFIYATARTAMYRSGKAVEILASFEPAFTMICEWWKQLFGECEGKEGRGLFPASVTNTTDLHSLGQYIQDGSRMMFETFLVTQACDEDLVMHPIDDDMDGLNYLADRTLHDINRQAWLGTAEAHGKGGVPGMTISIPDSSVVSIGSLLYFFEYSVALSGYASGINPFNQPGVEEYKKNMFRLLGKPA
jgi:glucose-6-phosphate isomerase